MDKIIREIKMCVAIIFMAPYALKDFASKHKTKIVITLIALTIIAIIAIFSSKSVTVIAQDDYTAVFDTGVKRPKTEYIVIHHAAGNAKISDIFNIHCKQNKWESVAYHYFIDADGTIYNLRSDDEKAPHTYNYNSNSVGVCLNGNFEISEPTKEQWNSCLYVVRNLQDKYKIPVVNVKGHKELNATACPGKNFDLSKFREEL